MKVKSVHRWRIAIFFDKIVCVKKLLAGSLPVINTMSLNNNKKAKS